MSELTMERLRENLESLKMKNTLEILDNYLERAVKDKLILIYLNRRKSTMGYAKYHEDNLEMWEDRNRSKMKQAKAVYTPPIIIVKCDMGENDCSRDFVSMHRQSTASVVKR
jgi:hypothetical protein